jgi:hypothetical protein
MKKLFIQSPLILLAAITLLTSSCKPKKSTAVTSTPSQTTPIANQKPKTTGKVSHEFSATGCGTVVIVPNATGGDPMILIPSPQLGAFDVEGQEISFHYHPLKMKNPAGCMKGFPAELTDITKN